MANWRRDTRGLSPPKKTKTLYVITICNQGNLYAFLCDTPCARGTPVTTSPATAISALGPRGGDVGGFDYVCWLKRDGKEFELACASDNVDIVMDTEGYVSSK